MRIVIKLGTSTIAHPTGRLNVRRMELLCKVLSDIKNAGHQVILVSSGAIGMGAGKLGLTEKPSDIPGKQAAAAIGQCELMYVYDELFGHYHHTVAQLLITGYDIENQHHRTNIENTLQRLLDFGALPVINENDTVATEEIQIGDNYTLSAVVATLAKADMLVLMSDIEGLYDKNPKTQPDAKLISHVPALTDEVMALAGGAGSAFGTGGMETKLRAGRMVNQVGIPMIITNGDRPELLYDVVAGRPVGTLFGERKETV